jgi:hypothetical protein
MITFIAATAPTLFLDLGTRSPTDASGAWPARRCRPGRAATGRADQAGSASCAEPSRWQSANYSAVGARFLKAGRLS